MELYLIIAVAIVILGTISGELAAHLPPGMRKRWVWLLFLGFLIAVSIPGAVTQHLKASTSALIKTE